MSRNRSETGVGRQVQAVQISCDILGALLELNEPGVTELASHLGYSKATVHGHLSTLYQNEFVVKDDDSYRLSLRFLDFSEQIKEQIEIYQVAKEETEKLAQKSGEFAQFMVEEHGVGVYLHKASGTNAVRSSSYIGHRKHLHCTALGKSILAQLPRTRVEDILDQHGLPEFTSKTITDAESLFEELDEIRELGISTDNGEVVEGLRCVASPVNAGESSRTCSVSVSGPASRMKGKFFNEGAPEMVKDAANRIELNASQL